MQKRSRKISWSSFWHSKGPIAFWAHYNVYSTASHFSWSTAQINHPPSPQDKAIYTQLEAIVLSHWRLKQLKQIGNKSSTLLYSILWGKIAIYVDGFWHKDVWMVSGNIYCKESSALWDRGWRNVKQGRKMENIDRQFKLTEHFVQGKEDFVDYSSFHINKEV